MNDLLRDVRDALAKATPGPWVNDGFDVFGRRVTVRPGAKEAEFVAMVKGRSGDIGNCGEADAHLIANAPAWLAALADRVDYLESVCRMAADVVDRQGIKKLALDLRNAATGATGQKGGA